MAQAAPFFHEAQLEYNATQYELKIEPKTTKFVFLRQKASKIRKQVKGVKTIKKWVDRWAEVCYNHQRCRDNSNTNC